MAWPNELLYGATYDPEIAKITNTPALIASLKRAQARHSRGAQR